MPVLPVLGALAGVASAASSIDQSNKQSAAMDTQNQANSEMLAMQKEDRARKEAASKKYWEDYNSMPEPSYSDSVTQANAALSPMYDQQMKTTLQNVGNDLKGRGFYGQLPGDIFTQNAAAKVEEAKTGAIGNMANQFYQAGIDRKNQKLNAGLSTFGTYDSPATTLNDKNKNLYATAGDPATLF